MKKDSLRVKMIGVGYLVVWELTRILPERWARALWDRSSLRSWRRNARRRAIVRDNLRPILGDGPELDRAVREAFVSYGRYWMEAFRLNDMSDAEVSARITFDGDDILDRAVAAGGAVLGVPHLGNWDAAGRYVAKRWGLAVVVEVLRPQALFRRFLKFRRELGMRIIPLVRGTDVTAQAVDELKNGRLLALVCDRDLSGRGIEVSMFGRKTKLPPGPAVAALRARVPLIPGMPAQTPDGRWYIRVWEPVATGEEPETPEEVAKIMQRLADVFAEMLRAYPAQWHAFSPYWLPE